MNIDLIIFSKAIADDTRQAIMKHLCCVWLSVNDLVDHLGGIVNQPTVSHHLKKLEEANLVYIRQEGRQRFYTLNQEQLTLCCGELVRTFAPLMMDSEIARMLNAVVPLQAIPTHAPDAGDRNP